MPQVNDIISVAESLEKSPIVIERDACVAVRNRNASCRRCVEICPVGALAVSANDVKLETSACVACGACTAVCPTAALGALAPTDAELVRAARASGVGANGRCTIACARRASKREADPDRYVEVPCLARVGEALIMELFGAGATNVLLVDGVCATCKYRSLEAEIVEAVAQANIMCATQGSSMRAQRSSSFPVDLLIDDPEGRFGTSRRGFFSDVARSAKDMARTAAQAAIEQELGRADEPLIGERLHVSKNGALPLIGVRRHDAVIDAMDALGAPVVDAFYTRSFARFSVDVDACNACGMCAVFCPTGAIKRDVPAELKESPRASFLEFSASACVSCGLCVDVCWKRAAMISPLVMCDELFDFEPVTIDLADAKIQPLGFDKLKIGLGTAR